MSKTKKRRSRGSGAIIKLSSGYYAYQYKDPEGKRKTKSLRTKNRREAESRVEDFEKVTTASDKAEVMVHIARQREMIHYRELPFADVWEEFKMTNPTAGEGTLQLYRRSLDEFVSWLGENRPDIQSFTLIDQKTAHKYMEHIWESGVSASTYNDKRNALGHITKKLLVKFHIDVNPWPRTERKKGVQQKRLPLTASQVKDLCKYFQEPPETLQYPVEMRCLFHLCLYAGMRLSDAVNLEWGAVNFSARSIRYTPAKTARTSGVEAVVPILPPLLESLKKLDIDPECENVLPKVAEHFQRNPDYIKVKFVGIIQSVTGDGEQKAKAQHLVSRSLYGVHSLRHTFASEAAKAGISPAYLSMMTGDSITTLQRFYVKVGYQQAPIVGFSGISGLIEAPETTLEPERLQLIELAKTLPIEDVKSIISGLEA